MVSLRLTQNNTRTVQNPDLASVSQAIGDLIEAASAAGHTAGSDIYFDQRTTHSLQQSAMKLGLRIAELEIFGELTLDGITEGVGVSRRCTMFCSSATFRPMAICEAIRSSMISQAKPTEGPAGEIEAI